MSFARLLQTTLQRLVSILVMRMDIFAIVDDAQSSIGNEHSCALVGRV